MKMPLKILVPKNWQSSPKNLIKNFCRPQNSGNLTKPSKNLSSAKTFEDNQSISSIKFVKPYQKFSSQKFAQATKKY